MAKVIRPSRFEPLPSGRATPDECGWPFVGRLLAAEHEVVFWEEHELRLTAEERSHLAHGGGGPVVRPVEPGWAKEDRLDVASNLWADVLRIEWCAGGYRTFLKLVDFRPRLPRRTTPHFEAPELGVDGKPIDPTPGAIAEATQDGNYTQAHSLAVPGIDEEVDERTQAAITEGALHNYNIVHAQRLAKREIRSLTGQLQEARAAAVKQGIDISPEVEQIKEQVNSIKRKVGLAA